MNRFLFSFATIVAVVNGYAVESGHYGGSSGGGKVIGGRAYQILPAASLQTIALASPSHSGYGASSGGYGSAHSGYGGSSGSYGNSHAIDIKSLLLAAGGDLSTQQLAKLALSLPAAEGVLIDTTGLSSHSGSASYGVPSGGKLAYAIAPPAPSYSAHAHVPAPYHAPAPAPAPIVYKAPAPAPYHGHAPAPAPIVYKAPAVARYPSAAAAASYIAGKGAAAAPAYAGAY